MKKIRDKQNHCLNCKTVLSEESNYCLTCGQENCSRKIPVKSLLKDALEDYFSFDSKFFRSFVPLLLKPGFLTLEFIEGKRIRYIPPFRLYLIISFIYFFVLSLDDDKTFKLINQKGDNVSVSFFGSEKEKEATDEEDEAISFTANGKEIRYDSVEDLLNEIERKGGEQFLDSLEVESAFERVMLKQGFKMAKNSESVYDYWMRNVSIMLFFLMPVFALLLKLFFRKNRLFYIEHLVFSFHIHSFIFLFLAIYLLIDYYIINVFSLSLALLVIFGFTVMAMEKVYQNTTGNTIGKALLIISIYDIVALGFLLVTILISLLLF